MKRDHRAASALRAAEQHEGELGDYRGAMRIARDKRNQAVYDAWLQGVSAAELAQALGLTTTSVHGILSRERTRLATEGADVLGIEHEHGRGSLQARRYRRDWW